jgi:hypothetical protein
LVTRCGKIREIIYHGSPLLLFVPRYYWLTSAYLLASEQPFLISHLRRNYDYAGRKQFEDGSAFFCLSNVFQLMDSRTTLSRVERFIANSGGREGNVAVLLLNVGNTLICRRSVWGGLDSVRRNGRLTAETRVPLL